MFGSGRALLGMRKSSIVSDAVHVGPASDLRSLVNADHPQLGEVFDK